MLNWDGVKSEKELLIRAMLWDDPREVVKRYGIAKLRETFTSNIHRFDRKNKAFWKLVLEVDDDEITRATEENFREAHKVWDY